MSTKLPPQVSKEIKSKVYAVADAEGYLAMSRTLSGQFLDKLVVREDIGGVLSQFVPKARVRHYIKDAILNRYSKDKTQESRPDDLNSILMDVYGLNCEVSHQENKITLFRVIGESESRDYVVVVDGTFLKWETALRKALVFISGSPFSKNADNIKILLLLFAQHKRIAPSDKKHLEQALAIANAKPVIFGEQ